MRIVQVASLRGRFQQPGFAASQHWSDFARHTAVQLRDIVDAMQVSPATQLLLCESVSGDLGSDTQGSPVYAYKI